ncbi:tetratricopeptide repeat protein [Propionivibrio dicarboxylicus]|nr:tetratricopeptide repeat-containing glycosyltransferase family protein [Propionivibrio dicarboxylicus]
MGAVDEAVRLLSAAPPAWFRFPPLLTERAQLFADQGRFEESLEDCRALIAQSNAGAPRQLRDQLAARALDVIDAGIAEFPSDVDRLLRRIRICLLAECHEQVVDTCRRVLDVFPDHPEALNNLGYALVALQRYAPAIDCYRAMLASAPDDADTWLNLGNVLRHERQLDCALDAYRRALALRPAFAEAHMEHALCLLSDGQFAAGWAEFEWRWSTRQLRPYYFKDATPPWLGDFDLSGKTIVLWDEQGLGDTLQFVRFVPRVADRAARVVLRVPTSLKSLLQMLDPRVLVIDALETLPAHDCHCPLMSVPHALGLDRPADFLCAPYLKPSPNEVGDWSRRLGVRRRLRVGVAWAGRQSGMINPTRDVPLACLARLWSVDADFFALQKDIPESDCADHAELGAVLNDCGKFDDFVDTAAVVAQLDLVIAVDSVIAHLAGALGTPCWLMLRASGEWRWDNPDGVSSWYPGVRVFRQRVPGEWDAVVGEVVAALRRVADEDAASVRSGSQSPAA